MSHNNYEGTHKVETPYGILYLRVTSRESMSVEFDALTFSRVTYQGSIGLLNTTNDPEKLILGHSHRESFFVHRVDGDFTYRSEPKGNVRLKLIELVIHEARTYAALNPIAFRAKHKEHLEWAKDRAHEKFIEARKALAKAEDEYEIAYNTNLHYRV